MSNLATLTVNVGNPAADVVFEDRSPIPNGRGCILTATSPQGDLAGELKLLVSSETTKSDRERTMFRITEPVYDASTGLYPRDRKIHTVIDRWRLDTVDDVLRLIEMQQKALLDAVMLEALSSGRP